MKKYMDTDCNLIKMSNVKTIGKKMNYVNVRDNVTYSKDCIDIIAYNKINIEGQYQSSQQAFDVLWLPALHI